MTTPSQPVPIKSPRLGPIDLNEGTSTSFTPASGTPNLHALRAQYGGTPPMPNIPLRGATPVQRNGSPAVSLPPPPEVPSPLRPGPQVVGGLSATAVKNSNSNSNSSGSGTEPPSGVDLDDLPDEEKVKVLGRHLNVPGDSSDVHLPTNTSLKPSSSSQHSSNGPAGEESEPFPIPYHAPGADITHDIYKWHADKSRAGRVRSVSFAGPSQPPDPAFEHIHEPGGFRRNYVLLRATEQGVEEPRILNNFIDFLFLFGHFAGEDLEEDEEEETDDIEQNVAGPASAASVGFANTETTPLLRESRPRSRSRRRRSSIGPHGNATVPQAALMLIKSFVGTGVMFLGKAFFNGGILFSSVAFVFIAVISLYSFMLLVKAKMVVPGSFGDIGGTLYGPWLRYLILGSIIISQVGFIAAYTIFVAHNLQAFVMGITHCLKLIPAQYFILLQFVIFVPLILIRDLAKLSSTALVADAFIFTGLIYIFGSEISIIAKQGIADVKLFNPKDFALFIGTAVFSFEGIGLIIPIADSMKEPRKFAGVLTGVMIFLTVLFGGAGVLAYLAFGSNVQTVVLVNLDTSSNMVQAVQFLYSLAILLSIPLQFFPVTRIMENGLFTRSGKTSLKVKWYKNLLRVSLAVMCTAIASFGSADLDKFVALVGCFACIPLSYVYPAMLHYKACARSRKAKIADIAMIVFGVIIAAYSTVQTIRLMIEPQPAEPPIGSCDPHA